MENFYDKNYLWILETDTTDLLEERYKKGIQNQADKSFDFVKIIPNPVQNFLTVNYSFFDEPPYLFKLLSVNGKNLQEKSIVLKSGHVAFDIESLPKGIYILQIRTPEKNIEFKRFIKK